MSSLPSVVKRFWFRGKPFSSSVSSAFFAVKSFRRRKITFSDFSYTEMVLDLEPCADAITLDSDPYVIIRPEGDWDRPGVLDISSGRSVTSPLRRALAET